MGVGVGSTTACAALLEITKVAAMRMTETTPRRMLRAVVARRTSSHPALSFMSPSVCTVLRSPFGYETTNEPPNAPTCADVRRDRQIAGPCRARPERSPRAPQPLFGLDVYSATTRDIDMSIRNSPYEVGSLGDLACGTAEVPDRPING